MTPDEGLTPPSPLSLKGEGGEPLTPEHSPSPGRERGPGGEAPCRFVRWLALLVGVSLVAAGALALSYRHYLDTPIGAPGDPPLVFDVAAGAPFAALLDTLGERGVVRSPFFFKLCGVRAGYDARIKAGSYVLPAETTPRELWQALVRGAREHRPLVTLPEGSTIWREADLLAEAGVAPHLELLDVARQADLALVDPRLPAFVDVPRVAALLARHPEYTWLEGVLAPDTYDLAPGDAVAAVVRRLVARFFRTWDDVAGDASSFTVNDVTLTPYEALILASLVEREVRVPDERRLVASVFWNRLQKGMRLETDPTLVYTPLLDGEVPTSEHRRDATNPFNTYAHDGLPPTPICSPGRAALKATLSPATTDYLYFVARGDGTGRHYFAPTFEEHRRNILYAERERLKRGE